jgi:hypothetical protein
MRTDWTDPGPTILGGRSSHNYIKIINNIIIRTEGTDLSRLCPGIFSQL